MGCGGSKSAETSQNGQTTSGSEDKQVKDAGDNQTTKQEPEKKAEEPAVETKPAEEETQQEQAE